MAELGANSWGNHLPRHDLHFELSRCFAISFGIGRHVCKNSSHESCDVIQHLSEDQFICAPRADVAAPQTYLFHHFRCLQSWPTESAWFGVGSFHPLQTVQKQGPKLFHFCISLRFLLFLRRRTRSNPLDREIIASAQHIRIPSTVLLLLSGKLDMFGQRLNLAKAVNANSSQLDLLYV